MEFRILSDVLDNLNPITDMNENSFQPRFDYGTEADLLKYLKQAKSAKIKTNVYPLVWIETPVTFSKEGPLLGTSLNIILATISDRNWSNRKRTATSFQYILDPLREEVLRALNAYDTTRVSDVNQDHTKYFNYENDLEKGATDIWDAITLQVDLVINLNCVNV